LGYPGCLIHSLRGTSRVSSRIFHNLSDHWRATILILGFLDFHHLILGFCALIPFNFGFSRLANPFDFGLSWLANPFYLGLFRLANPFFFGLSWLISRFYSGLSRLTAPFPALFSLASIVVFPPHYFFIGNDILSKF